MDQITPPGDSVFKWAMDNPEEVRRAISLLNALKYLEVAITVNGVTHKGRVKIAEQGAVIDVSL